MTYYDIIVNALNGDEQSMVERVKSVSGFFEDVKAELPSAVKHFLKNEYIAINGEHFNETAAHYIVSNMHHTTNGKKAIGELITAEDAQQIVKGMEETRYWDAYVAANTMAHDLANTGFTLNYIMIAAKHFFFFDEDFDGGNKVFGYYEKVLFK